MLFNSIDFAVFLPIVFFLYWTIRSLSVRLQNILIVIASYVFYGWWDYRFLTLIIISTAVDFLVATRLQNVSGKSQRKLLLGLSLMVNLGILGFFKYYNFFVENFASAFSLFGQEMGAEGLDIVLPVGISFYTFQTLSYTIDVYRKKIKATKDWVAFAAFVGFFPQLVAGPIERATHLLPQFYSKRSFDYLRSVDGLRQMLWGLFKKVVIADSCAPYVDMIFGNSDQYPGSVLLLGAFLFSFQIYADFSGYSDIAIGTSRLFGFNLRRNFAFPYFSRDIAEFWRRWHISLSTWFRDYLYIPLGGSRGSGLVKTRNVFLIFIISGFWHGANWTFIAWGVLNALYFLPLFLLGRNRDNMEIVAMGGLFPRVGEMFQIIATFGLTVIAWIFFRAENMSQALFIFSEIFSSSLLTHSTIFEEDPLNHILLIIGGFTIFEWIGRKHEFALESIGLKWHKPLRWGLYLLLCVLIAIYSGKEQDFIYFQF